MLLMLLLAYGAVATPQVQRYGWFGLVPETGLVLTFPFLSDKPGSAMSFLKTGMGASPYEEFVLDRFSEDHGGIQSRYEKLNWLNRRLVIWIAKRQPTAVLTDASAVRGNVFCHVISSLIRKDQLATGDIEWANSQIHIEFNLTNSVSLDQFLYSGFRARRLKRGAYRLMIGRNKTLYKGYTSTGTAFGIGGGRGMKSNEERIESFTWDNLYKISNNGGTIRDPKTIALGKPYKVGKQTGAINVQIMVLENEANRINGDRWVVVGDSYRSLRLPVDESRTIPTDAGEEVGEKLARSIRAKLTVVYDRGSREWVPVVKLEGNRLYESLGYESVLFGGDLSVMMFITKKGEEDTINPRGIPVLKGEPQVWSWTGRGRPESRGLEPNKILGQVEYAGYSLPNSKYSGYEFAVRVDPRSVTTFGDYGGLEGDVMYPFRIDFVLEDWTPEELTDYIVNGAVPAHAIP